MKQNVFAINFSWPVVIVPKLIHLEHMLRFIYFWFPRHYIFLVKSHLTYAYYHYVLAELVVLQ